MKKNWSGLYSWLSVASDMILGLVAGQLLWRLWFVEWGNWLGPQPLEMEQKILVVFSLLLSILLHGGYRNTYKLNRLEQILNIYKSSLVSLFSIILIVFIIKGYRYSRGYIVLYYTVAPFFLSLGRVALFSLNLALMKRGWGIKKAVIAGSSKPAKAILDHLLENRAYGYQIVGFLVGHPQDLSFGYRGVKAIGLHSQCNLAVRDRKVEKIFIPGLTGRLADYSDMLELCRHLKIEVSIISHRFDLLARAAGIYDVAGVAILSQPGPFYARMYPVIKRILDIGLSSLALLLFSPLMLFISLMIKLNSPGPVFFRQQRFGKDSRLYQLMKFRTMRQGTDKIKKDLQHQNEADGPIFKMKDDPRITRVGRWLRRLSLDELPQLINVFRGEMSLVGPRPPLPSEVEHYQKWHKYRLNGPQGMTGLWQVSGRSELSFEEMVLLDIYYLEHWSPMMDIEILIKTIPAVITAKGAY
ncbi:sugar transferase [candidate division TA06 bacterium]|uniref:Sugar transferase n=1 Tax=candidate division TA06 bacterium TaxID=2250710 RepID=A0A933MJR3_UNCT6|nr:sugar transferase [candidate division TA06 bacterium]